MRTRAVRDAALLALRAVILSAECAPLCLLRATLALQPAVLRRVSHVALAAPEEEGNVSLLGVFSTAFLQLLLRQLHFMVMVMLLGFFFYISW